MPSATLCITGFSRDDRRRRSRVRAGQRRARAAAGSWCRKPRPTAGRRHGQHVRPHELAAACMPRQDDVIGLTPARAAQTDFCLERPIDAAASLRGLLDADWPAAAARRAVPRAAAQRPPAPRRAPSARAGAARPAAAQHRRAAARPCRAPPGPQPALPALRSQAGRCRRPRSSRRRGHADDTCAAIDHRPMAALPNAGAARAAHLRLPAGATRWRPGQAATGPARRCCARSGARQTTTAPPRSSRWLRYVEASRSARRLRARSTPPSSSASKAAPAPRSRSCACCGSAACSPARATCCPASTRQRKYRLTKWPQTEREYPQALPHRHRDDEGPGAAATRSPSRSGVPREEVVDFVNANLATGFAEVDGPEPADRRTGGCSAPARQVPRGGCSRG